jgi:SAM-dependent methyltransferase
MRQLARASVRECHSSGFFGSTFVSVDEELQARLARSGYHLMGFAAHYDRYRLRPPSVLLELLPLLAGGGRPRLVVDLGSGTGLSTRPWADVAEEVVGVEPNDAMRDYAEGATERANVRYLGCSSYATGLAPASVDIVTAAQSLQWMRRKDLFREVARILRTGGLFCAYNYFVLQTPVWEAATAFDFVQQRKGELRLRLGLDKAESSPPTLEWLKESAAFREARELVVHSVEDGDGDRLLGFALSEGSMRTLLEAGASETDVGLDRLRAAADRMPQPVPWWIGYRVWLGRK